MQAGVLEFHAIGPVLCGFLDLADDFLGEYGGLDEAGAGAVVGYGFRRAAHVDVDAVEAERADDQGGVIEIPGDGAVDLGDHRPFDFVVEEAGEGFDCAVVEAVDIDEFGDQEGGVAVFGCDVAEGAVGDAVHGGEAEDRSFERFPEI